MSDNSLPQNDPSSQPPEEWRDIPGYEGLYQVSDQGRVRSAKQFNFGSIKRLSITRKGYSRANLCRDSKQKNFYVHVLMAAVFIGPKPEGHEVDHINRIRDDNRIENLRYLPKEKNRVGHAVTPETRAKMSAAHAGKTRQPPSLETRQKLSLALKAYRRALEAGAK